VGRGGGGGRRKGGGKEEVILNIFRGEKRGRKRQETSHIPAFGANGEKGKRKGERGGKGRKCRNYEYNPITSGPLKRERRKEKRRGGGGGVDHLLAI